jgi:hypothetical protein
MSKLCLEKHKMKIDFVNTIFDEARTHLLNKIKNPADYYKTVIKIC